MNVDDGGGDLIRRTGKPAPGGQADIFDVVENLGDIRELDGSAAPIGDDQTRIILTGKQLAVRVDLIGPMLAVKTALCLVRVRCGNGAADVFQIQAIVRELRGIHANPNRWLLPSADANEPNSRELGNFGR